MNTTLCAGLALTLTILTTSATSQSSRVFEHTTGVPTPSIVLNTTGTPTPTDYKIGVGLDSLTGMVRGDCVVRTPVDDNDVPKPQRVAFSIQKIQSVLDLSEEMGVDLSGSLSAGFGNASAKASWMNKHSVHDYSIYLLVRVTAANLEHRMRDTMLKQERIDPLKSGGMAAWQDFRRSCGDRYITGMRTGGQFYTLYKLTTKSESEKESLDGYIRAAGITGSWGAEADFSKKFERMQKMSQMEGYVYYEGPSTTIPDPQKQNEVLKFALEFPTKVQGAGAWEYEATWLDYDVLPNMPKGNPIGLGQQKWVLDKLVEQDVYAKGLISGIAYVLANRSEFDLDQKGLDDLIKLEQKVIAIQKEINGVAAACYELKDKCDLRPAGDLYTLRLPMRKIPAPIKGTCAGTPERFLTIDGGCRDMETGFTWSAVAAQPMSHPGAINYCASLTESGVSHWVLPTLNELVSLSGEGGAAKGLRGDFDQWYWTLDQYRVDLRLGLSRAQDPRLTFGVICRRATN
jgi:hypothetical protein